MEGMLNIYRREAMRHEQTIGKARLAIVDSYDPDTHCAKVRFQPEDALSGWLPIGAASAGGGGGAAFAPSIGDQVVVEPLEGSKQAGFISWRLFSNEDRPPAAPAGEFWLQNATSGSIIKLQNDGSFSVVTTAGQTFTVGADLTITVVGTANITATTANLIGDVNLGATGGKKVALDGDPIVGGVIQASSTKVKAV